MQTTDSRLYSATELAEEAGTTARALRFYEDKGLLAPRRVGSRRVYGARDRGRLKLILRGKRLGFTLADIREYLDLYDADPSQVEQMTHLRRAVDRRLDDLVAQREALEQAITELRDIRRQADDALGDRGAAGPGGPGETG